MIDLRSSRTRVAASIVGALAIASCTFLGSRELTQCDSDGDCFGSKVVGANNPGVCVEHLCAEPPRTEAGADGPAEGAPDARTDAPILCKTTIRDCPDDHLCVDGTCQRLVEAVGPCPRFANSAFREAYKDEGRLIVGAYVFAPASLGAEVKAVDLAVQQINQTLPPESQIAVVLCEKKGTRAGQSAQRVVDHLAGLKLPLLIGQFETSELIDLKTTAVAVWSTLGNYPSLQQIGDAGGPTDGGPVPFRFLVDELQNLAPAFDDAVNEAAARADILNGSALGASVKVRLVLGSPQIDGALLADRLEAIVPLMSVTRTPLYDRNKVELMASFETGSTIAGTTATEIAGLAPHIIVAIGGDEVAELVTRVENLWVGAKRPVWVLGARGKFSAKTLSGIADRSGLRQRIIGVDFAGATTNHTAFRASLPPGTAHGGSFDNIYDALYAAAYAGGRAEFRRGASRMPYSAFDLNRGLDEVLQPEGGPGNIPVSGTAAFPAAFIQVKAGKTVAFTGTTGPWLFPTTDATHGVRRMGTSYYCFPPKAGSELTYYVDALSLADKDICARPP